MEKLKAVPFLLALLLLLIGCSPLGFLVVSGAAGVGGYEYHKTSGLTIFYDAPYLKVWESTLTALKKMEFEIESAEHDLSHGEVTARRADNTPVTITLKYKSDKATKATIRVGLFDDKDSSLVIKEQIQKILTRQYN